MVIGILSVRNHRYHPNKRLIDATKSLKHQAVLVHPGKIVMGAGNRGLKWAHIAKSLNRRGAFRRIYLETLHGFAQVVNNAVPCGFGSA